MFNTNRPAWYRQRWAILPLTYATDIPGRYRYMKTDRQTGTATRFRINKQAAEVTLSSLKRMVFYFPRNQYQLQQKPSVPNNLNIHYFNKVVSSSLHVLRKYVSQNTSVQLYHPLLGLLSHRYKISTEGSSQVKTKTIYKICIKINT